MMREDRKQKLEGFVTAAMLIAVPFLLNACSGNPLNGEKLRLWKNSEGSTPAPGPNKPGKSSQPVSKPTGTPTPVPTNACKPGIPDLKGRLDDNDKDLLDLATKITALEAKAVHESDLEDELMKFTDDKKLELKPKELRTLQKKILALSNAQPVAAPKAAQPAAKPQAAVTPSATPIPAPAPTSVAANRLHPSVVATIAFEAAVEFALDKDNKLEMTPNQAAGFAAEIAVTGIQPIASGENDLAVVVFIKAFKLATKHEGLGYSTEAAMKFIDVLFTLPNGNLRALTWVANYDSEVNHSHYQPSDAIADANEALGYTPNPSNPAIGFCGYTPVPVTTPTPVAGTPVPMPITTTPTPAR